MKMADVNHKPRYVVKGEVGNLGMGTEVLLIGVKCLYVADMFEPTDLLELVKSGQDLSEFISDLWLADEIAMDQSNICWLFTVCTKDGRVFEAADTEFTPMFGAVEIPMF
jgi:hypothetical protein